MKTNIYGYYSAIELSLISLWRFSDLMVDKSMFILISEALLSEIDLDAPSISNNEKHQKMSLYLHRTTQLNGTEHRQ